MSRSQIRLPELLTLLAILALAELFRLFGESMAMLRALTAGIGLPVTKRLEAISDE